MIVGGFGERDGRPYVQGRLYFPRLKTSGDVDFLVDTGADRSCIHPSDGLRLGIPFNRLRNPERMSGIGGSTAYYRERAFLFFDDGTRLRLYVLNMLIHKPSSKPKGVVNLLQSLLGQDMLARWRMVHDVPGDRLAFIVKHADRTFTGMNTTDLPPLS